MRFLVVLIVLLLLAYALWPRQPTPHVDETFVAPQVEALRKVERVEDQYLDALERTNERIEKDSDGG